MKTYCVSFSGNLTAQDMTSNRQSPDSGRSTGTGLTAISDANQNDNKPQKEPMTPVVEESSRSSKASKLMSREGTLNRGSANQKQNSSISEKSVLKGTSLHEEAKEDSTLNIKHNWSEGENGVGKYDERFASDLERRESKAVEGSNRDSDEGGSLLSLFLTYYRAFFILLQILQTLSKILRNLAAWSPVNFRLRSSRKTF